MDPYFIYEITPDCNSNCIYCYNVWKNKDDYPSDCFLTLNETQLLFNRLVNNTKISGVTITGGEPLLHDGLFNVLSFLKDKGIKTAIASNGTLLTEEKILQLINCGVSYFEISIDSIKELTYKSLTNNSNLDSIKKAIINIVKYKKKLSLSAIITRLNIKDIPDLIDLAFAFSVKSISLNRYIPVPGRVNENLTVSDKELKELLTYADKKSREYAIAVLITIPVESCIINHNNYPNLKFGTCTCGEWKWTIDPAGNLRTCEQNPEIIGNLLHSSFKELAQKSSVLDFKNRTFKEDCFSCGHYKSCGGGCRFLDHSLS